MTGETPRTTLNLDRRQLRTAPCATPVTVALSIDDADDCHNQPRRALEYWYDQMNSMVSLKNIDHVVNLAAQSSLAQDTNFALVDSVITL